MSPSKQDKVLLPLATAIRTEDGIRTVDRGEPLPEGTLAEEKERLERNEVLGTPAEARALARLSQPPPAAEVEGRSPKDAAAALVAAETAAAERQEAEEEAAAKEADRILSEQGLGGGNPDEGPPAPTLQSSEAEFDAFTTDATADQVVAAAGDDPELAGELLASERSVRGEDARKTVVEALEAKAQKQPEGEQSGGS